MKMNLYNTNAHDFRSSKRKCFSLTGCLIFVLLMSQASCRPSETDSDNGSSDALTYNDEDYQDADDINWKNFAAVEATTENHPIIFYKEDIVSADYDPNMEKNETTSSKKHHVKEIKPHHRRKYKEISRHHRRRNQTESNRYIKPEKVYFDIYPIEHDGAKKDANDDDSVFNEDNIHIEVISLLDDDNNMNKEQEEENPASKDLLDKKPKKYNHRHRRDVTLANDEDSPNKEVSFRHKRNPFYHRSSHYANQLPQYRGVFFHPQVVLYPVKESGGAKHPIKSPNYYNAYSPGGFSVVNNRKPTSSTPTQDGIPGSINNRVGEVDDRPVWPMQTNTKRPSVTTQAPPMRTLPPRRPAPPLLQFGDEDYVTPPSSSNNQAENQSPGSVVSASAGQWSLPVPQTTPRPPQPISSPAPAGRISACIWAISSCCTRGERIRYSCFERLGCSGAFWDLNPCADDIVRLAVKATDQYRE